MACFTGHLKAALLIAGLLILFGCTNNRATHNEILVQVSIEADPEMNPDINQRASPAELHIYFLNSPTLFQEQDYYNLIDSPEQALKHDFVSRNSLIITPGQQLQTTLKTPGSYQHAGVIASFRDLNKSQWQSPTVRVKTFCLPFGLNAGSPANTNARFSFMQTSKKSAFQNTNSKPAIAQHKGAP